MRSTEIESKMLRQIVMMAGLHADRTHKLPHNYSIRYKKENINQWNRFRVDAWALFDACCLFWCTAEWVERAFCDCKLQLLSVRRSDALHVAIALCTIAHSRRRSLTGIRAPHIFYVDRFETSSKEIKQYLYAIHAKHSESTSLIANWLLHTIYLNFPFYIDRSTNIEIIVLAKQMNLKYDSWGLQIVALALKDSQIKSYRRIKLVWDFLVSLSLWLGWKFFLTVLAIPSFLLSMKSK